MSRMKLCARECGSCCRLGRRLSCSWVMMLGAVRRTKCRLLWLEGAWGEDVQRPVS